jgi:3',5'-cyclic-AMP phosphodiesterase
MRRLIVLLFLGIIFCGKLCLGEDFDSIKKNFPELFVLRARVTTVTTNTATIVWQTPSKECGEVNAWTQDHKIISLKETKPAKHHSVTLRGLQPDMVYHYVISGTFGASNVSYFKTLKTFPGKCKFTMAIVADPQFDGVASSWGRVFAKVVDDINQRNADIVIIPGDMVDNRNTKGAIDGFTPDVNGYSKAFTEFKQIADKLKMPYYVTTGNHERLEEPGTREAYLKIFNLKKAYYSFDYAGQHFIIIDCKPKKAQLQWLKKDLNANRDKNIFVSIHYAVANDPYVFDHNRGVMPEIQKLFEQHGKVRAVYNGHKNVYSITIQKGILYVSCPQPAASPSGYLMVEIYNDGLIQTFHNSPGTIEYANKTASARQGKTRPDKIRWDCNYRWGRQDARNFSWRFGDAATSTGIK